MTTEKFPPLAAYLTKLERRHPLPPEARDALLALPSNVRHVNAQEVVVKEDSKAEFSVFLLEGLISRQKRANSGGQIISISFPTMRSTCRRCSSTRRITRSSRTSRLSSPRCNMAPSSRSATSIR